MTTKTHIKQMPDAELIWFYRSDTQDCDRVSTIAGNELADRYELLLADHEKNNVPALRRELADAWHEALNREPRIAFPSCHMLAVMRLLLPEGYNLDTGEIDLAAIEAMTDE